MPQLRPGDPAPPFELQDDGGQRVVRVTAEGHAAEVLKALDGPA